jgi:hypothetical protein
MKATIPLLLSLCLLSAAPRAFALAGNLDQPGIALPKDFPRAERDRVMAALNRKDCRFLGGKFVNWMTTLRYGGDTRALNLFLDDLAHCPGIKFNVSFARNLGGNGDWHVHHDGMANSFHIRVSLDSQQVKLEDLYIPSVKGVDPVDMGDDILMQGYDGFDQRPGRGWRAYADQGRHREAAEFIERYLAGQGGLEDWQKVNLHFHAAQCHALSGEPAGVDKALAHLQHARHKSEYPESPVRWNDYVDATEAFLRSDLKALKAARARIAAGPKTDGKAPNLDVVDRLIERFGKPYAEAYKP